MIDKAKNDHRSVTKEVCRNLPLIEEARREGIYWVQIAEALGFPGKFKEIQTAFAKEKRKIVNPQLVSEVRKAEPIQIKTVKTENEIPKKTGREVIQGQKHEEKRVAPPVFNPTTGEPGQRIGQVTLTGKGRFQVNEETPLDEL